MNLIRTSTFALAAVLSLGLSAIAEVKIEEGRALMPAKEISGADRRAFYTARISPDDKSFLYGPKDTTKGLLLLRDIQSGAETVLPLSTKEPGITGVFLRYSFFSNDGTRLLLVPPPASATQRSAPATSPTSSPVRGWSVLDIATAKSTPLPIGDARNIAHFAPGDTRLVISEMGRSVAAPAASKVIDLATLEAKPLTSPGWVQSVSPKRELATFYVQIARNRAATQPATQPTDRRMNFVLWDLAADKLLAELPTHPRNGSLDDIQAVWSRDGRFVAYGDLEPNGSGSITRIWDTEAGKEAAVLPKVAVAGPGKGDAEFILGTETGDPQRILLYDAATNTTTVASEKGKRLVHGRGDQVLYLADKEGVLTLFHARLVQP